MGNASFGAPAGGAGAEDFYQKMGAIASGSTPPMPPFTSPVLGGTYTRHLLFRALLRELFLHLDY